MHLGVILGLPHWADRTFTEVEEYLAPSRAPGRRASPQWHRHSHEKQRTGKSSIFSSETNMVDRGAVWTMWTVESGLVGPNSGRCLRRASLDSPPTKSNNGNGLVTGRKYGNARLPNSLIERAESVEKESTSPAGRVPNPNRFYPAILEGYFTRIIRHHLPNAAPTPPWPPHTPLSIARLTLQQGKGGGCPA